MKKNFPILSRRKLLKAVAAAFALLAGRMATASEENGMFGFLKKTLPSSKRLFRKFSRSNGCSGTEFENVGTGEIFEVSQANNIRTVSEGSVPLASNLSAIGMSAPFNVLTTDNPVSFTVSLSNPQGRDTSIGWRLTGYFGNVIRQGKSFILDGQLATTISLGKLQLGHYQFIVEAADGSRKTNLSIVPPLASRKALPDSPFAINLILGVFGKTTDQQMRAYSDIFKLAGFSWMRDSTPWSFAEKARNDFSAMKPLFENLLNSNFENGIKIFSTVQGCPPFYKYGYPKSTTDRIPQYLDPAYRGFKAIATYCGPRVGCYEVGNEWTGVSRGPDELMDRVAAYTKASVLGVHDSGIADPHVTFGGMEGYSWWVNIPALDTWWDNDLQLYVDNYNFHNNKLGIEAPYDSFPVAENILHNKVKTSIPGTDKMPTWIGEAGGSVNNSPQGLETYEKQRAQARYWTTAFVLSAASFCDKFFWLGSRGGATSVENPNDMNPNAYWANISFPPFTCYAAYVAAAIMSYVMGKADYLGKVELADKNIKCYVFNDGDNDVVVFWANSARTLNLNIGKITGELTDIMGGRQIINASGGQFSIPVNLDIQYLKVSGNISTTYYAPAVRLNKPLLQRTFTPAQRIIIDQFFPNAARQGRKLFSTYLIDEVATTIDVNVYNFNEISITGTLIGSFDQPGYNISAPQTIKIPAQAKVTKQFIVSGKSIDPSHHAKLTFVVNSNVGISSRSTSYCTCKLDLSQLGIPTYVNACDNLNDWLKSPLPWAISGGRLTHKQGVPPPSYRGSVLLNGATMRDGVVSVIINMPDTFEVNNTWGYSGIAFRRRAQDINIDILNGAGFYALLRRRSGEVLVHAGNGTKGWNLSKYGIGTIINTIERDVEFTIRVRGVKIDMYIDRVYVGTMKSDPASPFQTGMLGMVVSDTRVQFSNFRVWKEA